MMFGIVSLFDSRQVEHDLSLSAHSLGDDHGYVSVSDLWFRGSSTAGRSPECVSHAFGEKDSQGRCGMHD